MPKGKSREQIEGMRQIMHEGDQLLIDQERRRINMRINTQYTVREINDIIRKGGDGGEVLNLIMDKIFNSENSGKG